MHTGCVSTFPSLSFPTSLHASSPFFLVGIVFNFMTSNFIESKAINSESVEYSNGVCNTRMLFLMSVSVRHHYEVAWNTNRSWKELAIIRRRLLFTMESFLLVFLPHSWLRLRDHNSYGVFWKDRKCSLFYQMEWLIYVLDCIFMVSLFMCIYIYFYFFLNSLEICINIFFNKFFHFLKLYVDSIICRYT